MRPVAQDTKSKLATVEPALTSCRNGNINVAASNERSIDTETETWPDKRLVAGDYLFVWFVFM